LYSRIGTRFDEMLASGLVEEVRRLYDRGDLHADLPSMRAVGYRQLWQHFAGKCTLLEAISAAKQATRNLAKRQLTWLRGDVGIDWLRSLEDQELGRISEAVGRTRPA
jgi:tRNA dimethylallyltransferase